jgi:hypothetical protein
MKVDILEFARQIINRATREYLSQYHGQEWEYRSKIILDFEDWLFSNLQEDEEQS